MLKFVAQCLAGWLIFTIQLAFMAVAGVVLVVLRVLEALDLYVLPSPAEKASAGDGTTILVLEHGGEPSPFLAEVDARALFATVRDWSEAFGTACTLMVSDESLRSELEATVRTNADLLFFKIFYNYPGPEKYRYHGVLTLEAGHGEAATTTLVETLTASGFSVSRYAARRAVDLAAEEGAEPRLTALFIGKSTLWSRSAAQYLFDLEVRHLLHHFNRMSERVTYWVEGPAQHDERAFVPLWLSYESHGTMRDMLFAEWQKRQTFTDLMFLNLAGITTLLYAGLDANDVLARDPTTFAECTAHFGRPLGSALYAYKKMFGHRTGSSNQAVMFNVRRFGEPRARPGRP